MYNQQVFDTIIRIVDALKAQGYAIPRDLDGEITLAKTAAYYEFSLQRAIRDLYNSGDVGKYIDHHSRLINEQLTRAWREGMKEVDMNSEDMSDEEKAKLQEIIDREEDHVLNFAQEIIDAREAKTPPTDFINRSKMWANRYREVVNIAKTMASKDGKFEWVLGPTEHCKSCLKLSGIVKRGSTWAKYLVYPQNAPNDKLECGGWNCQCELKETTKDVRRGPFPRLP